MKAGALILASVCFLCAASVSRSWEIEAGPGWFLPRGDWSRGFSSGKMLELRVYFPFTRSLTVGGGLATVSMPQDEGQAALDFILPGVLIRYELSPLRQRLLPHVGFKAGVSREVLKVGLGRESDFDIVLSVVGGLSWKISGRTSLQIESSHVWFFAPDGATGFTLVPSFRIAM